MKLNKVTGCHHHFKRIESSDKIILGKLKWYEDKEGKEILC